MAPSRVAVEKRFVSISQIGQPCAEVADGTVKVRRRGGRVPCGIERPEGDLEQTFKHCPQIICDALHVADTACLKFRHLE